MGINLYKLTKALMTSSSFRFHNVIKMRQLKSRTFLRVFSEYLKNSSNDFHQTHVILGNHLQDLEIKRFKTDHSLLRW